VAAAVKSQTTGRFWSCLAALPAEVQNPAAKNYALWRTDARHPSLFFKPIAGPGRRFSVRVGAHYRAVGREIEGGVEWVWIGTHAEYDHLLKRG